MSSSRYTAVCAVLQAIVRTALTSWDPGAASYRQSKKEKFARGGKSPLVTRKRMQNKLFIEEFRYSYSLENLQKIVEQLQSLSSGGNLLRLQRGREILYLSASQRKSWTTISSESLLVSVKKSISWSSCFQYLCTTGRLVVLSSC